MESLYVQYGCGLSAPEKWINYDISPTLRLQKIPFIGNLLSINLPPRFPKSVQYGDIIKGLPVPENSCKGLYCSHTLEHLSLIDLRIALKNTYKILEKEGIFRCVLPDLEFFAREYLTDLDRGIASASLNFMGHNTLLGVESRPKSFKGKIRSFLSNANHLWMWDYLSLSKELKDVGFINIRRCSFNDSADEMFKYVESEERFLNSLAIECTK